jgi:peroxiredoxin
MQKLIWILFFCTLSCCCWQCSAAADNPTNNDEKQAFAAEPPNIRIKVAGIDTGMVRLVGMLNDKQYVVDQMEIGADRVALFQKDEPYQQGIYFVLLPNNANFQLIISEDQSFEITADANDLLGTVAFTGSKDNELLYRNLKYEQAYQSRLNPINNQLNGLTASSPGYDQLKTQRDALIAERDTHLEGLFKEVPNSFFTTFKKAGQNPKLRAELPNEQQVVRYRRDFWASVDLSDERLLYTPVIYNKTKRYFEELTTQQPDSIITSLEQLVAQIPSIEGSEYYKYFVNWVALNYEPTKTTLMDAEAVWVYMVKNHFTYERAFWSDSTNTYALQLRADEMSNSLVGQPGPNVKAPDPNGQIRAIYDLEAPYIIVYLYNPDCEHCQEQTPVLVNLHRQWQQQSPPLADVYAIAIDTEDALWRDYMNKTGMKWTNVYDPSNKAIYKTYYVNVTPEVYVLGPDRKIIAKNLNVSQINEVIERDQAKRK